MYYKQHYAIDWDKVQTLDDVKRLIRASGLAFEQDAQGLHEIMDLVRLEDKPPMRAIFD